jgi:hypothetical protein
VRRYRGAISLKEGFVVKNLLKQVSVALAFLKALVDLIIVSLLD